MTTLPAAMAAGHPQQPLVGRAGLLSAVRTALAAGRSVLLVGPEGAGKTAIARAAACAGTTVVDPWRSLSSMGAARVRRLLDAGGAMLGAARTLDRRELGRVGHVLWRFQVVCVRPLAHRDVVRLLDQRLTAGVPAPPTVSRAWIHAAAMLARGLPGRAIAISEGAVEDWHTHGVLRAPALMCFDRTVRRLAPPPARRLPGEDTHAR
jgi:energy-coupling factor transporter ATP-binding protein EcfA2